MSKDCLDVVTPFPGPTRCRPSQPPKRKVFIPIYPNTLPTVPKLSRSTARDLYLLGNEIRLRISGHNGFYDLLSLCQNARPRAKSNATQERVSRYQFPRIARIVLQRVDQQPRPLRNEIGVQHLPANSLLCQQVAQVPVPQSVLGPASRLILRIRRQILSP